MTIDLVPLGSLSFRMPTTLRLAPVPSNTRVIVEFSEVRFEGARLRATQRGPAADWLTIGPEGTATLDIRLTLETHDGALIYVEALGRTNAAKFASDGGPMFLTPRFETGDARYAWLNDVQAVAKGMSRDGGATFECYALR